MSDQANDKWDPQDLQGVSQISQALGGALGLGGALTAKVKVPWRQRIREQHLRAAREAGKAERLDELNKLLDAYPDVARILELVDELGD